MDKKFRKGDIVTFFNFEEVCKRKYMGKMFKIVDIDNRGIVTLDNSYNPFGDGFCFINSSHLVFVSRGCECVPKGGTRVSRSNCKCTCNCCCDCGCSCKSEDLNKLLEEKLEDFKDGEFYESFLYNLKVFIKEGKNFDIFYKKHSFYDLNKYLLVIFEQLNLEYMELSNCWFSNILSIKFFARNRDDLIACLRGL